MINRRIILKVASAYSEDVGKGKARISSANMRKLGIEQGSIVLIVKEGDYSGKGAVATAWRMRKDDNNPNSIRIDGITRANADLSVGDNVHIKKVEDFRDAKRIVLTPVLSGDEVFSLRLFMNEEIRRLILPELMGRPVRGGDLLAVMRILGGGTLKFRVLGTSPSGIVRINAGTRIEIKEPAKDASTEAANVVSYEDIGGLDEYLSRIREMIELPIRHPELFAKLGIEPPKGVLLHGPPGTGKTLIARAVANEAGAHFISIQGPEIISRFYGESEAQLRNIFSDAEKNAPSIIFLDEIDSIAPRREDVSGELERRVVAQLLTLMDGLKSRGKVIVIGATNRPDALDPALRRPGRFDREIEIPPPDKNGRLEILKVHTRGMPLAKDVDLDHIAQITHGYVGADIEALCREAAMMALRRYLPEIDLDSEIPARVLQEMEITKEDFRTALIDVEPSAIREIYSEVPRVSWDDIGGMEDIKELMIESVEIPINEPERISSMGIIPPKGILIYGAPGTGKTMLAKAIASRMGVNFISIKGPEVMSKWVGESEKAIRNIFKKAKQLAPAIIFFDEIDSMAPRRGMSGENRVTERIVNQLLTSMDSIEAAEGIIVLAATNRPDIVDPALLRAGRFDVIVKIPLPDRDERTKIFQVHTRRMPLGNDVDIESLAAITEGYTGADISNLCREAAMTALRSGRDSVLQNDFLSAMERVGPSIDENTREFYDSMDREIRTSNPARKGDVEGYY